MEKLLNPVSNCPLANTFKSVMVGLTIVDMHACLLLLTAVCFSALLICALWSKSFDTCKVTGECHSEAYPMGLVLHPLCNPVI